MIPLTFDRHVLSSLPPMDAGLEGRVLTVLRAVVQRRVLPWFAGREDVDAVQLARASERHHIARYEDVDGELDLVSFVTVDDGSWTVFLHDRVFDYIAFGLPANPVQAFEPPTDEAAKVMALAEFILRHELDHIVRPGRSETDVLTSDCRFLTARRDGDPTYHETLMAAFRDATNGLQTESYLELLAVSEETSKLRTAAEDLVAAHLPKLAALPRELLSGAFMTLDSGDKRALLSACYRRVSDDSLTVAERSRSLDKLVDLLERQRRRDDGELARLFEAFLDDGDRERKIRDLELDLELLEQDEGVHGALVRRLVGHQPPAGAAPAASKARLAPALEGPHLAGEWPQQGSLKERIEAARQDPNVPQAVKRAIDNNAANIDSHSSAKYTEFIETLLAVPWGRLQPIDVGPREFAAGLDAGHFGLAAPKELIADFFANLIWRYRDFDPEHAGEWKRTGSAFLFVGPPGVGKTSLAISIAKNLGLPYHKISLGGMRDESVLRGHGFTYEGSKPGAIVQGLIKMEAMNGLFILDEADKTEPMTVATLLEILDPEQNHLFHDKYTLSTVDIDLSNCHFILTANTLDTVPPPVIDRCQVVHLDRYSVEEKVEIARRFILPRLRDRHGITTDTIDFESGHEDEHLRYVIRTYTNEAGVRQLELALRTLLLRVQRRHLFEADEDRVEITHNLIKRTLELPAPPAAINSEDRVGESLALGVNAELGVGGMIPVQATRIGAAGSGDGSAVSMVHATGNLEKVMDESRRVATTAILHCAEDLGIDPERVRDPVHLHFLGASTRKDGPSAGTAIALALASLLTDTPLRRDVAATGEVDTQGRIKGVGGLDAKLEIAASAGCRTVLVPRDNLTGPGGIDRLPEALRRELQVLTFDQWHGEHEPFDFERHSLQVVAVDHILQAFEVARVVASELAEGEARSVSHARTMVSLQRDRQRCAVTVVVKAGSDVDPASFRSGLCERCSGCCMVVPTGMSEQVEASLSVGSPTPEIIEVEPGPEALGRVLVQSASRGEAHDGPVVVVAPYFALLELDTDSLGLPPDTIFFANNFLAQGLKLKGVKASLNRAVCRLLHHESSVLETFPLLARRNDIYVADLSLVPEKYRLDPGRCEELLERYLGAWLAVVEDRANAADAIAT